MLEQLRYYAKAHIATIGAVSAWLTAALQDGTITGLEWIGLVVAITGGGAVAAVRNGRKPVKRKPRKRARARQ